MVTTIALNKQLSFRSVKIKNRRDNFILPSFISAPICLIKIEREINGIINKQNGPKDTCGVQS